MQEYNVASTERLSELVSKVNHFLGRGWKLHGGVSVAFSGSNIVYAQAVARLASTSTGDQGAK